MSKVYLVSTGCYSDYKIEAVFSTKTKAKKYADIMNGVHPSKYGPEYTVEDFALDDADWQYLEKLRDGWRLWCVQMDFFSGNNVEIDDEALKSEKECTKGGNDPGKHYERTKYNPTGPSAISPYMFLGMGFQTHVWTDSEKKAIKIANERRIRYMAEHPEELERARALQADLFEKQREAIMAGRLAQYMASREEMFRKMDLEAKTRVQAEEPGRVLGDCGSKSRGGIP